MRRIDIITGASSGIGKEFARQYFYKTVSDEMWLIARRGDRLESLADELNSVARSQSLATENELAASKKFPKIRTFAIDISGKEGVARFKNLIEKENCFVEKEIDAINETGNDNNNSNFNTPENFVISLLFNNAGFGTYGPFVETPIEREMQMIDLNCISLTGICGVCIPYMESGSVILNTASLAAFLPLGNFAVYAATKSYVLSFSYALAAELKEKGIHVCALSPGSVSTEFANVASNGARKEVLHGKSVEKVASHAIRAIEKKKYIAIMHHKWKLTAFCSRFIGRYFGAWFTYKFNKRPHN